MGLAAVEWHQLLGPLITVGVAIVAFTVQWGIVIAKLAQLEKRLDSFIHEAKATREKFQGLEVQFASEKAAAFEQHQQIERRLRELEERG